MSKQETCAECLGDIIYRSTKYGIVSCCDCGIVDESDGPEVPKP